MKRISIAMIVMAIVVTVALMAPWVAYQHFVDPPGNNVALAHLAGVYDLSGKQSLLEAIRHSYANLTATEIISYKTSNLLAIFGDVFQGPPEWAIIPRNAKHLFRDASYCSLFWAFGLLNLGFAFLGIFHRHDQIKRHERRVAIVLLLACGATVCIWLLTLFGPGTASIHHGTHFVPLVIMTALALLIANVSRPLALVLAAANALLFYWVYVPWPDAPRMPDAVMLTVEGLAFVVIMGLLYWYYLQTDSVVLRPWRPSMIAILLAIAFASQAVFALITYAPYGLKAVYYKNNFEQPIAHGIVWYLSKNYADSSPARSVPREHFTARFEGILHVPEASTYTFESQSDDGFRLFIDDYPVIDNWQDQQWDASKANARRLLTEGNHSIRADYFNGRDEGAFRVRWAGGPVPKGTVLSVPFLRRQ